MKATLQSAGLSGAGTAKLRCRSGSIRVGLPCREPMLLVVFPQRLLELKGGLKQYAQSYRHREDSVLIVRVRSRQPPRHRLVAPGDKVAESSQFYCPVPGQRFTDDINEFVDCRLRQFVVRDSSALLAHDHFGFRRPGIKPLAKFNCHSLNHHSPAKFLALCSWSWFHRRIIWWHASDVCKSTSAGTVFLPKGKI